jgi:hypothetical protein
MQKKKSHPPFPPSRRRYLIVFKCHGFGDLKVWILVYVENAVNRRCEQSEGAAT